ncbi:O-glycosyl hydrolase [Catenovulum agarivorans DS-2]|uniref:O-glycosyl hydrolase n=1 Tax=Catenovulum agarivorans DS-2 TaxID=1328313 RepID=W7QXW3_9ALTE|nr:glycoside hydrolase family 30 beta sandwich domain-containing protein [Catenovulum agarivorans]EWH10130.1 O-glycosyl hydrolase [Catenovulum agarivorans DS-2]
MLNKLAILCWVVLLVGCGGASSESDNNNPDEGNTGVTLPEMASQLVASGNNLPSQCEFTAQTIRPFSQCRVTFAIQLTAGSAADAAFVGQVSDDNGVSWTNLTTDSQLNFFLDAQLYSGDVLVRAKMNANGSEFLTQNYAYRIVANSVSINAANDFAELATIYFTQGENKQLHLPSCNDSDGDATKVELSINGRYWLEQQPNAKVNLAANTVSEGDVLAAACVDSLGAKANAPGQLQVSFAANPQQNQAPVVAFANLADSVKYFSSQLRDYQQVPICLLTSDADGDVLTASFQARIDNIATSASQLLPLATDGLCTELDTSELGGNQVVILAEVSDGVNTTAAELNLGLVHRDSIPIATSQNSSCLVGENAQTVNLDIDADAQFDPVSLQVIDLDSEQVLKQLNIRQQNSITFDCNQLGLTRYQIRSSSRGQVVNSVVYSHSVTQSANQAPEVSIDVTGDRVGLLYRDNQTLEACVAATDGDNDSLTASLTYAWDSQPAQPMMLSNGCASVSTQGRGGQQLTFFATVDDGQTQIQQSLALGQIHADTIQFAQSESLNCTLGADAVTYSFSLPPDSEGDEHTLSVIEADSSQLLFSLGSATQGQFQLSCEQLGNTPFVLRTESRGLTVQSTTYQHTVTQQPNQAPSIDYSFSAEQFNDNYRDYQTGTLCFSTSDPEGQMVTLSGSYTFDGQLEHTLNLDSNQCMTISLFDRGGQTLAVQANASDGEVSSNLAVNIGPIYKDTIQIASSQDNSCTQGDGSLTYNISLPVDIEGDATNVSVFDARNNQVLANLGQIDNQASFALSCQQAGVLEFYVRNQSRGLTTYSRVYQHTVNTPTNTPPTVALLLSDQQTYQDKLRDNHEFEICLDADDADGDNLTTSLSYSLNGGAEQAISLNSDCGRFSTNALGNQTLVFTAVVTDGIEQVSAQKTYQIHQDTVQFAYTNSQTCRQGDDARIYSVEVADDIEGDSYALSVYHATTNQLIANLGTSSPASFSLNCNANGVTPFVIRTSSRDLSSLSVQYQHVVAAQNNSAPNIDLTINADAQRFNGLLRDQQSIQVCASVSDAEDAVLNTQVFYRFDNQTQQSLSLNNLCGSIDLTSRGGQNLTIEGFVSDGTATGNDTINAGVIHLDSVQTALSSSGSCRAGEQDSVFAVQVAADVEGDPYSIDVVDAISLEVLASLGQITAGTFSLSCDAIAAVDFMIRTVSRSQVQYSLVYSHVVSNTLNAKPTLTMALQQPEEFNNQLRDGQEVMVCLAGSDADGDTLSYRAAYQFSNESFQNLALNSEQCASISTRNRGGQSLIIQGFVNDAAAETTSVLNAGEIHQDTLATAATVSSECSIGETSIEYSIDLADDEQGDARGIQVLNQQTSSVIASFTEGDNYNFSMACDTVGQTSFLIQTSSRDLVTDSATYTHTVNPSLTNTVDVWRTAGDASLLLTQRAQQILRAGMGGATIQVDVSDSQPAQQLQGFGANLTDSAASLIFQSAQASNIVNQIFSTESGIGLQHLRVPLSGMGEFIARAPRSYNDMSAGLTDPELSQFSLADDEDYLIPLILDIQDTQADIALHAVSWSAPAWMKDNESFAGGSLRIEFYQSYADYWLAFMQGYQQRGIEFASISLQNQPHLEANFPSMSWSNDDYLLFFEDFWYPTVGQFRPTPEFWLWDGNWTDFDSQQAADLAGFARSALADDFVYGRTNAIALQCYQATNGASDYTQAISQILAQTRTRPVYLTSCRNQHDGRSFGQYLTDTMTELLMPALNAGASAVFYDSLALDGSNGPVQNGCTDCRGLVTIDNSGSMTANPEYYAFGHISKFLQDGAVLISSTSGSQDVATLAYKNPDNTVVVVLVNTTVNTLDVDVNWQGQYTQVELAAYDMVSLIWDTDNSPVVDLQQIAQTNTLAQNIYQLIDSARDDNGLYRPFLNVDTTDNHLRSGSATGLGLIALSIAHNMQWDSSAAAKIVQTLQTLNAENEAVSPATNVNGWVAQYWNEDGSVALESSYYSAIDTALLLAGIKFAEKTFTGDTVTTAVDTIVQSVIWDDLVSNASLGEINLTQDADGISLSNQGVYHQQMLAVWFAMNMQDGLAEQVWQSYYQTGQQFPLVYVDGNALPADENSNSVSALTHQLNFYLVNHILNSANYRQLFLSHAQAEKVYWDENFSEPSYVWGFGLDSSIDHHSNNIADVSVVAGFVGADASLVADVLAWQDNNLAILDTQVNGIQLPWRYDVDDISWQSDTLDMRALAVMLMGLSAHPGLLDVQYFRQVTNFEF